MKKPQPPHCLSFCFFTHRELKYLFKKNVSDKAMLAIAQDKKIPATILVCGPLLIQEMSFLQYEEKNLRKELNYIF